MPEGLPFALVNREMNKKAISRLINECYRRVGLKDTVILADRRMYAGFHYATRSGVSFGADDMVVPDDKAGGYPKFKVMGKEFDPAKPQAYIDSFAIKRA